MIGLWRFPLKSFGGEALDRVEVGELGLAGDRQWGVLAVATGKVLTARREPRLLFASARLAKDGSLDARLPDGSVANDTSLSDWLGYAVRIVRAEPGEHALYETPIDFEDEEAHPWFAWDGPEGVFHDSKRTRFSLVSTGTIGEWDLRRFRTNVIVDGVGEDELVGQRIRVGTVVADVVKQVDRCVMTTRPQPGIERDLDVLRSINKERAGNLAVGCVVTQSGTIAVGDDVICP
ncbi:MAG TPA: MOSC N-terminal beta barrel domain-containing protein [Acidimicrobiales bacterium]|nr:MOSC N-terminal beta barrel domain-containing protein [Acidimicrobiales bacterium]